MTVTRKLKILALTGALGAAAAHLFDPALGRVRRERLVRGVEQRANDLRDAAGKARRIRAALVPPSDEPASSEPSGHVPPPEIAGVTDEIADTTDEPMAPVLSPVPPIGGEQAG